MGFVGSGLKRLPPVTFKDNKIRKRRAWTSRNRPACDVGSLDEWPRLLGLGPPDFRPTRGVARRTVLPTHERIDDTKRER